jgi:membrane associated rhomboid family serine protease
VLQGKEYHRFLTAGFLHVGIAHLAFNMITLYFFGPILELTLGPIRYLILYLGSELTAHFLTLYFHRNTPQYQAIGASGAISGIVFAFCLFQPFQQICLFFFLCLPAILFAVLYVGGSIYAMRQQRDQSGAGSAGGLAHEAHLGGALGGLVLTLLLEPRSLWIFLHQLGL